MKDIITICFLLFSLPAIAQQRFTLLDQETQHPIVFAHFVYGNQQGSSDEKGQIQIRYQKSLTLYISHINYGKQEIEEREIEQILTSGKLFLKQSYVSLLPATVIARRRNKSTKHVTKVESGDKLSHDAGEFLGENSLLGGIRKSGRYGFDPVLRGFKYKQLNIVMDNGVSATAACPNRMDPPISQIPLNLIDQIEIVKGPHSLRYGASFGGSIHFKSTDVHFPESQKIDGRMSSGFESNGLVSRSELSTGIQNRKYHLGITAAYSEGTDYKDGNGEDVSAGFNRRNLGIHSIFKMNSQQSLHVNVNHNYAKNVDFPALNMDLREDDTYLTSILHKLYLANGSISSSAYLSVVDHEMDNLRKQLDPRKVNAVTNADTKNYGGRVERAMQFPKSALFIGADVKREQADAVRKRKMLMGNMAGKELNDNLWQNSRIKNYGVFAEYHFSKYLLDWTISSRIDLNQAESKDIDPTFQIYNPKMPEDDLNISFSLGGTYAISKNVKMGFWFGRAVRSGSLTERFINQLSVDVDPYERIGNTSLSPEINHQIDYSFTWQSDKKKFQFNLFFSTIKDYISAVIRPEISVIMPTAPGVKQYVNIDKAVLRGFEFSYFQNLGNIFYQELQMAYTYGKNLDLQQALPEIPPLDIRYSLVCNLLNDKFQNELSCRYVSEQNRIAEDFGETKSPDFYLFDYKISYYFSDRFQIKGGVRNLFDKAYYEHLSRSVKGENEKAIFAPGRNIYFSFLYQF